MSTRKKMEWPKDMSLADTHYIRLRTGEVYEPTNLLAIIENPEGDQLEMIAQGEYSEMDAAQYVLMFLESMTEMHPFGCAKGVAQFFKNIEASIDSDA